MVISNMGLVLGQVEVSWDVRAIWDDMPGLLWVLLLLLILAATVLVVPRWRKKVFGR